MSASRSQKRIPMPTECFKAMIRALRRLLLPNRSGAAVPAPGPDALVQVYHRADGFFVEPSDRTRLAEAGFWIGTGEVTRLAPDASDSTLGDALLRALACSRVEVAVPPRGAKLEAGLFRAMGVRSRRAAMAGTRACLLSREPARSTPGGGPTTPARLRIEALHNGGTSGDDRGYRGLSEPVTVELPIESEAAVIGQAVRTALQEATVVS